MKRRMTPAAMKIWAAMATDILCGWVLQTKRMVQAVILATAGVSTLIFVEEKLRKLTAETKCHAAHDEFCAPPQVDL